MTDASRETSPELGVTPLGAILVPDSGLLDVEWELANLTAEPVQILETWLPHGRLFAEREAPQSPLELSPSERTTLRRDLRLTAEPGETVENAFLNLLIRLGDGERRVLARMRVERGAADSVSLVVEAVTTHPVGFTQTVEEETCH